MPHKMPVLKAPLKPKETTSGRKTNKLIMSAGMNAIANTFSLNIVSKGELQCGQTFLFPHLLAVLEKKPIFSSQFGHLKNCSFDSKLSSSVSGLFLLNGCREFNSFFIRSTRSGKASLSILARASSSSAIVYPE